MKKRLVYYVSVRSDPILDNGKAKVTITRKDIETNEKYTKVYHTKSYSRLLHICDCVVKNATIVAPSPFGWIAKL